MKSWEALLSRVWEDVGDEYGPHGQQVVSAFDVLETTRWFSSIGAPLTGHDVERATDWTDALADICDPDRFPLPELRGRSRYDPERYGPNGELLAPARRCIPIIESPPYAPWFQKARHDAYDYSSPSDAVDRAWPEGRQDFMTEYFLEYVTMLLAEIIGAEVVGSTYFREMLAWFHAGRLPCGWVGDWPLGRMRVF